MEPPPPSSPPLRIQISLFNVTGYLEDIGIEAPFAFFTAFRIRKKAEGRGYPCTVQKRILRILVE